MQAVSAFGERIRWAPSVFARRYFALHEIDRQESRDRCRSRIGDFHMFKQPTAAHISIGDITNYSPWGSLAVFYRDFSYSNGLVKPGAIDSGVEALNRPGPLKLTIELMEK